MNQTEEPLLVDLQSISKYPLLSAAQEISLARAIQAMLNPPAGLSKKQLEEIKRQGRVAKETPPQRLLLEVPHLPLDQPFS